MRSFTRLLALSVVATVAFAMMPAHAHNVTVSFDNAGGDILFSLPEGVEELPTTLTGDATFDADREGGVGINLYQGTGDSQVITYAGQAVLNCAGTACTWSFRLPFITEPGFYTAEAVASQLTDPQDPESGQDTAKSRIDIVVL